MNIKPLSSVAYVLACDEPPCTRFLKEHKDRHFTHVADVTKASVYETEEDARDAFSRYAAKPRGAFSGGVTWDVVEMTTKVSFAQVKEPSESAISGQRPAAGEPAR